MIPTKIIPVRTVIADDHDIYRDGLRLLLNDDPGIELVGEADNGYSLLGVLESVNPDVVLTDLRMPALNGVDAIRKIAEKFPAIRCIALSTFESEHLIVNALEAGAYGYVLKNAKKGEIAEAIKTVNNFDIYYCKSTTSRLINLISKSNFNPVKKGREPMPEIFTEKEKIIIRMICEERSSRQIGEALNINARTIETARARILEKMRVKTPVGAVLYAVRNGLYDFDA